MTRLFTDNDHRYTELASSIDREANNALRPFFTEAIEKGYSPRELAYILTSTVMMLAAETVVRVGVAKRRKGATK